MPPYPFLDVGLEGATVVHVAELEAVLLAECQAGRTDEQGVAFQGTLQQADVLRAEFGVQASAVECLGEVGFAVQAEQFPNVEASSADSQGDLEASGVPPVYAPGCWLVADTDSVGRALAFGQGLQAGWRLCGMQQQQAEPDAEAEAAAETATEEVEAEAEADGVIVSDTDDVDGTELGEAEADAAGRAASASAATACTTSFPSGGVGATAAAYLLDHPAALLRGGHRPSGASLAAGNQRSRWAARARISCYWLESEAEDHEAQAPERDSNSLSESLGRELGSDTVDASAAGTSVQDTVDQQDEQRWRRLERALLLDRAEVFASLQARYAQLAAQASRVRELADAHADEQRPQEAERTVQAVWKGQLGFIRKPAADYHTDLVRGATELRLSPRDLEVIEALSLQGEYEIIAQMEQAGEAEDTLLELMDPDENNAEVLLDALGVPDGAGRGAEACEELESLKHELVCAMEPRRLRWIRRRVAALWLARLAGWPCPPEDWEAPDQLSSSDAESNVCYYEDEAMSELLRVARALCARGGCEGAGVGPLAESQRRSRR